jgi:hypothetical protein
VSFRRSQALTGSLRVSIFENIESSRCFMCEALNSIPYTAKREREREKEGRKEGRKKGKESLPHLTFYHFTLSMAIVSFTWCHFQFYPEST